MQKPNYIAPCRTIYLGETPLTVAMLANGDYRLSQTEVAGAIDKVPDSITQFLESQYFKDLSDQSLESEKSEEPLWIEGSNKPINPISIGLACLYWRKWAIAGNEKAQGLAVAMVQHSLQKQQSMPDTPTIRELKLRIRLAELELEKARVQKRQLEKALALHSLENSEGEGLIFKTWEEVEQFIEENFGEEASKWIPLEVAGEIFIVPRAKFKPELN
ncbi:MAG: hypothetical protein QNJ70_20085 [Xenococcaceae cyanobacterium MO_207.B15]|nr:hypothetical protein [Xenococcaceae cyanobacterium MO_207.B15]